MQTTLFPVLSEKAKQMPIYLTSIGFDYNEGHVDRPEGYADFQWLHTTKGEGEVLLGGKKHLLTSGKGVFLYPGESHNYYPTSEHWITEWITFNGKEAAVLAYGLGFHASGISEVINLNHLSAQIRKGYELLNTSSEFRALDSANYIFDSLVQITKFTHSLHSASTSGQYNRLSPIISYLEDHYHLPMELNILASMIDVSPQYLCGLFKSVTGTRPALYLNQLRINKAKELMLIHPGKTIAEVAVEVGYESPSYFGAIFKKHENQTPGQFISLHRS